MPEVASGAHAVVVGGVRREVRSRVERDAVSVDGVEVGEAWTFAYIGEGGRERPVLFLFNGGPGCASMWLHLSGLAPWRVEIPGPMGDADPVGAALVESADTILDVADLVFIDPVGTGFSRPDVAQDGGGAGADHDARATADIVDGWLRRNDRLDSPVHLLGESYGTIRAALAVTALRERGIAVAGVALLGQCLNAQETTQRPGNLAGYVAAVPFLAATAWFHGRGAHADADLDTVVDEAHDFAIGDYAAALMRGADAPDKMVVDRMAGFTGLTAEVLVARRLRIDKEEFRRLLLADEGAAVGLTDARYRVSSPPPEASEPDLDAADLRMDPRFALALHRLFTDRLGLAATTGYRAAVPAHEGWDYLEARAVGRFGGSALPSPFAVFDYPAHLAAYLRADASARVFVGTGHFDALTTVGSARHLLAQYGLPARRITERRYPAGHMMYTDAVSRAALAEDLRSFILG